MAFYYWTAASKARCYGGDRLLTNFYYPRERQCKYPCVFHADLRDSVGDWRVTRAIFLGCEFTEFGIGLSAPWWRPKFVDELLMRSEFRRSRDDYHLFLTKIVGEGLVEHFGASSRFRS